MSIAIEGGKAAGGTSLLQSMQAQASGSTAGAVSSTGSGDSTAGITSADFMTLLVTEMKNQDPTSPTDPTQYVLQLVNVNSLQQLVSINQGVAALTGSTTGTAKAATL